MSLPDFIAAEQVPMGEPLWDLSAAVSAELAKLDLSKVKPGDSVAITAGSRGIDRIPLILSTVVEYFRAMGAQPFILCAMGSHGGGTTEGQLEVLSGLGITQESVKAEIFASMMVEQIGTTRHGMPIYFSMDGFRADHLFVVNRVKPHTIFFGRHGSGLLKMLVVGCGKLIGAQANHQYTKEYDFDEVAEDVHAAHMARGRLLGGLAIVENGGDKVHLVEGVPPAAFPEANERLCKVAEGLMPRIPADEIDLLIIDEIGKDISGSGMDPGIVGRRKYEHCSAPGEAPSVKRIYVRGLSEGTHGNAAGIGFADFGSAKILDQMDTLKTYMNCVTAGMPAKAAVPVLCKTDMEAIDWALKTVMPGPNGYRIVWIKNTSELNTLWMTKNLIVPGSKHCFVYRDANIGYDVSGNLARCDGMC
jgi:hypothetical protein